MNDEHHNWHFDRHTGPTCGTTICGFLYAKGSVKIVFGSKMVGWTGLTERYPNLLLFFKFGHASPQPDQSFEVTV